MKLIKKYNINIKTEQNIIIKDSFSNAYYKKIIDENLPIDPMDKHILKSSNYCGMNKIKERIFLIKKSPKIKKENANNFSLDILMKNEDEILNKIPQNFNENNKSSNFSCRNIEIFDQIIFQNELYMKQLFDLKKYFINEILNDENLN
jgi:hypothetical protein